jgi:hypothetical protein
MKRVAVVILILLLLGAIPLATFRQVAAENSKQAKVVSIEPTDDRWVAESGYVDRKTYRLAVGTYKGKEERTYLKFDLRDYVPRGAVIIRATLQLTAYYHYGYLSHNVSVYGVLDDNWSEDTITWSNKPTGDVGPLDWRVISLPNGNVNVNYTWDVTEFVKDQLLKDGVVTFYLHSNLSHVNTKDYIYFASKENSHKPHPKLIVEYYVPVAISNLTVSEPLYTSTAIRITSTITNIGSTEVNVTYTLTVDNSTLETKLLTIPAGQSLNVTSIWTPKEAGYHTIVAKIQGDGFSDKATKVVKVTYNPYVLFASLSRLYYNMFEKEYPAVSTLYENFSATVKELQKCGVGLGDLAGTVKKVNLEYSQMQNEYQRYLKIRQNPLYQRVQYSYPLTLHIRKALFLGRDVEKEIKKSMPLLQRTLEMVQTSCNQQANQTVNQTGGTNVTIKIPKVLIDLSHDQYYLKSYGYENLKANIENELGWEVEINLEPLTYDKLKDYDVLILTNPKKPLTDEEISAIREFVQNGGGLVVAGDWYKYVNAESLNALLAGTGIHFEKTELMDDEENSGRSYYPFVGIYNRNCSITKFIPDGWKMYYNGDTLMIGANAVWVIRGFESSYAVDAEGNTVYQKGSEPVVAAAVTFGKGRVVAYGSSRAFSDAYYNKYIKSNWPFIKGALLWLVGQS